MSLPKNYFPAELTEGGYKPFTIGMPEKDGVNLDAVEKAIAFAGKAVQIVDATRAQALIIRGETKFLKDDDFGVYPSASHLVRAGVGTNNINMNKAAAAGMVVVNTPGGTTDSVARRAFLPILQWTENVNAGHAAMRNKVWPAKSDSSFDALDTSQMSLGVIGLGRIGKRLRKMIEDSGPPFKDILFHDVMPMAGNQPLDVVMSTCHVISVHSAGIQRVVTKELIDSMPDGALLVNTSRGEVVDTKAAWERMQRGTLYFAGDVFEFEGPEIFKQQPWLHDMVNHPHCVMATPHRAAGAPDAQRKVAAEGAQLSLEYGVHGIVNPNNGQQLPMPKVTPVLPDMSVIRTMFMHGAGDTEQLHHTLVQKHQADPKTIQTATGLDDLALTYVDFETTQAQLVLKVVAEIKKTMAIRSHRSFLESDTHPDRYLGNFHA